ncbi:MAG: hypothetical protein U0350_28640 [Caldilineaceae bacterium]
MPMTIWPGDAILAAGDNDGDQRLTLAEFYLAYDKLMAQPTQFDAIILALPKTGHCLVGQQKCMTAEARGGVQELSTRASSAGRRPSRRFAGSTFNGDGYLSCVRIVAEFERILLQR